jgi:hypothetical protein
MEVSAVKNMLDHVQWTDGSTLVILCRLLLCQRYCVKGIALSLEGGYLCTCPKKFPALFVKIKLL